jgi:predicted negative regulator of RcsB-dependent stress response
MAQDADVPLESQLLAQTAFVQALIDEGQLDSAAQRLTTLDERVPADERQTLVLTLARARIAKGELDLAAHTLVGDSSVAALALQGWVALYRGQLKQAAALFRAAGPYAVDRRDATERTAMLALLQQIQVEQVPELGAALLRLSRRDSVGAIAALERAARQLSSGGRPDVLLLAGRVAASLPGHEAAALQLLDEVVQSGAGAAAPAAELTSARVLVRQGKMDAAIARLEHLILTYPGSAFVPEARRELERARGAIPRS